MFTFYIFECQRNHYYLTLEIFVNAQPHLLFIYFFGSQSKSTPQNVALLEMLHVSVTFLYSI